MSAAEAEATDIELLVGQQCVEGILAFDPADDAESAEDRLMTRGGRPDRCEDPGAIGTGQEVVTRFAGTKNRQTLPQVQTQQVGAPPFVPKVHETVEVQDAEVVARELDVVEHVRATVRIVEAKLQRHITISGAN